MFRIFTFGLLTGLALDLCTAQQSSNPDFSCKGRPSGYYADVASGCQLYHMCDGLGRQFSYTCPNATLFQQRMLVCDHWYMVNCSRSEGDYSANLLIGQKKPFVEDSGTHPYSRTPRPDLLSHPSSESEFNIIYRTGKNNKQSKNIVGIEEEQSTSADKPTYYPPSHWSTEYPSHVTTAKPVRGNFNNRRTPNQNRQNPPSRTSSQYYDNRRNSNQNSDGRNYPSRSSGQNNDNANYQTRTSNQNYDNTDFVGARKTDTESGKIKQGKAINVDSSNRNGNNEINNARDSKYKTNNYKYNEVPVNYKSNFKATTPVFPSVVETQTVATEASKNIRIIKSTTPSTLTVVVAEVTPTSTEIPVNYKSNFKATTPVFPITVEDVSVAPNEIGILPPIPYRNSKPDDRLSDVDNNSSESSYKNPDGGANIDDKDEPQIIFQSHSGQTASDRSDQETTAQGLNTIPAQQNGGKSDQPLANFKSDFKATTPVYPTFVDTKNSKSSGVETEDDEPHINFKSDFKATTPVYPSVEEVKKLDVETDYSSILETPPKKEPPVNFVSNFKATTPVYPTSVEPTSPDPGEVGLLAPQSNSQPGNEISKSDVPALSLSIEPPKFDDNYKKDPAHLETTIAPPSMFYQPPKLEPQYSSESETVAKPGIEIENIMKSLTSKQWQNLRQRFHIPEYEFPLDDATRPSYDSSLNSFAAKAAEKR